MGKIKEYKNDDLTIIWQPEMCKHAGVCVKMLPQVYNPRERPWIKMENATKEELIRQIDLCPSGALSYKIEKRQKLRCMHFELDSIFLWRRK